MSAIEWALLVCIIADCSLQWRTERRLRLVEQAQLRHSESLMRMVTSDREIAERYQHVYREFTEELRRATAAKMGATPPDREPGT